MKNKSHLLNPRREALKIALPYCVVGILWITISDCLLGDLIKGLEDFALFAFVKGTVYVLITALLVYLLVRKLVLRLEKQRELLDDIVKERTMELAEKVGKLSESELQKDDLLRRMQHLNVFERLVLALSQDFINSKESEFDAALDNALRCIGRYMDEDIVFYARYDWDSRELALQMQFLNESIAPVKQRWLGMPFEDLGEILSAHMKGANFSIRNTEQQSATSELAAMLWKDGVRSFMAIPVRASGQPHGFIGLCAVRQAREWDTEALSTLSVFAEMIKNAYKRLEREAALKRMNSQMSVILNATRDGICLMAPDGTIITANKAFSDYYDMSANALIGKNIDQIVQADTIEKYRPVYESVLETGNPQTYRDTYKNKHIEASVYPVYGKEQEIIGVAAFLADITRRVNNEREIFRSHQMLEKLINDAPTGIYWKDLNGVYQGCNRSMADSLQTTPEEMIGSTNRKFMTPEDALESSKHDREVIESKKASMNYFRKLITQAGETKLFRINKMPLLGEDGEVYALLGVAQDVTEQHAKEKELIEAKHTANMASRAKSEFMSRMSHEIRTPLNAIIGLTHVARESRNIDEIAELLDKVNQSSKHLLSIVNDILDISRIEAGKMTVVREQIDIVMAIEEIVGIVLPRANEKKQKVDLYIDEALPRYVLSDAVRFKQVLMNLLSNAVKFTPDGGEISVKVQVKRRTENKVVAEFSVTDNGIGISTESQKKLFVPFEQADTTLTRGFEGTGLGLAISRTIVELMDGEIGVESEINKGSTFYFVLPLEVVQEAATPLDIDFDNLDILVVDDDKDTCLYMTSLLEKFNVTSSWVTTGQDAITSIEHRFSTGKPYNVVFVDARMPGMDGIETVREIRQRCGQDTFVIMFSMYEWADIEKEAKSAGVSLFLPKPIFPSKLLNTLYQICRQPIKTDKPVSDRTGLFKDKRILVAEDVSINQYIIREMLKTTQAQLIEAYDGRTALQIFVEEQGRFDAILMDIQMPNLDGLETARRIRSSGIPGAKQIPIIAMTANVFKEDIDKTLMAGMDAHLGKPIDAQVLVSTLSQLMKINNEVKHCDEDGGR